jgi:hypothetical protein
VIHLVYFQGEPGGGDLFYVRADSGREGEGFSRPIRVNREPGAAIAIGTIRGGQLALGRNGRVHVAWNGTKKTAGHEGSPMLYARLNQAGTSFEPQRDLMRRTGALDGGGTVAADSEGNVYVAWHGRTPDAPDGEQGRRFWVARSRDDGATFTPEEPAFDQDTGACGCCGARAFADSSGTVYALYRAATRNVDRDMVLLISRDHGRTFQGGPIHRWHSFACPMSSETLAEGRSGVLAAWETRGQVYYARINPRTRMPSLPVSPPGDSEGRKHPAVASNARGETILVWTEGTGWQKGGALAWQVFDPSDRPTSASGRIDRGIPVWGLATVVARPDGGFTIIH